MRTPRAFTLIELLVAIGIVSVLGAMVMPAINRAYHKCKRSILLAYSFHAWRLASATDDWGVLHMDYLLTNGHWEAKDIQAILPEGTP